ncbi:MAG: glycosyltransferase family 39 protein [Anaerolineae bacterium]|nr:glycosyltransferase family 39 protein [Anaerolineae bacterium]
MKPDRIFGVLLLAFVVVTTTMSLINPLFEAPDEIRHYRYIRKLVTEHTLPIQGQEEVRSQSHHPPLYYTLAALASAWVPSPHTSTYDHPLNPFWGYRNWEVGVDNKLQYWHGDAERFPFREGFLAAMIPRWVNVLFGALAVVLTYWIGRRVWPDVPVLALGSAAAVAFNPQFIYMSAAIDNDIIAAACGAAILFLCVRVVQDGADRRTVIWLGSVYGCALLSKLHLAVAGVPIALVLFWEAWQEKSRLRGRFAWVRRWMSGLIVVGVIALVLAGWWFVRNWILYGDPTGMRTLNELWAGRSAGGNWWAIGQGLPYLWASLWGRFGYGQIPLPQGIYTAILVVCAIGLLGYVIPGQRRFTAGLALLLILTIVVYCTIVLYYMLIQPAGAMGRFLFPALPAFAIVVVGGFCGWLRTPVRTAVSVSLSMALLLGIALGGYFWPAVRYPPRATVAQPSESAPAAQFGDVARVLAVEVSPVQVRPGEPLWVQVTWEPLQWTARPYAVYIHLIDETSVVVSQRDTWPGLGRAPTTSWRAGRTFVDTYRLDVPESAYTPNRATVRLGLYEPEWGRLPLLVNGTILPDQGLEAGEVEIAALPRAWPNAQFANFAGEIAFVGYTLRPRNLSAGETLTVTLYWQVLTEPRYNYAIFAQVLDAEYHVWGSYDGGGVTWTPGETVTVTRPITLLPETPPGSYPLQVGLFHSETGRLPVIAEDGHYLEERVLLGPISVRTK